MEQNLDGRAHSACRFVPAPPDRVYEALMTPQRLVRWLPPEGAGGRIELLEPFVGGRFRMTLTFTAAQGKSSRHTDVVNGSYTRLVPGRCVVQDIRFESEDAALAGVMTMTWQLDARPGGTEVTVRAENVPAGISRDDHEAGMASTLANLAAFFGG